MMKPLAVLVFALAAYGVPADAASLTSFAEDGASATSPGSQDPSSDLTPTKTADFVYYTIEVPVDWTQLGTGKLQPGDKTLLVTALNLAGIEATASPEHDAEAMKSLMTELEKSTTRTLISQGCNVLEEFSAKDIDGQRSLIRGVFQANTGMTGSRMPADPGKSDKRKRTAMLDAQTLADRYVAVWNEADANNRRAAIAALWVPDGQHYVEGRQARGYEALEERIRGSHEKNVRDNGNRFRAAGNVRRLRDVVTFHWEMLAADSETVLATGLEFLIIDDDGRVLADYQFFPG